MNSIQIKKIKYVSNRKDDAVVEFESGVNILCGSSDTGKSYIAETIDYMFGGGDPPRDIPQAAGYSSIEMTVEILNEGFYLLKRGYDGGDFLLFSSNQTGEKIEELEKLTQRFQQGKTESISGWLLSHIDSLGKKIYKNKKGEKKNLSFRDFARLVIVQETEIIKRNSPFLTGQYLFVTPEKSTIKYMLTGVDDSDEYQVEKETNALASVPKVELIDEWISELNSEIAKYSERFGHSLNSLDDIEYLASRADTFLAVEREKIRDVKNSIGEALDKKRLLVNNTENRKDRIDEINELSSRFQLLSEHYSTDLQRLDAIIESGSLIIYEGSDVCPLCGARNEHQNSDTDCDANFNQIVEAARQEKNKIHVLARELGETKKSLRREEEELIDKNTEENIQILALENEIRQNLTTELASTEDTYSELLGFKKDVEYSKKLIERKSNLLAQRKKFSPIETETNDEPEKQKRLLSDTILNEFSVMLETTLNEWHYPNSDRIHFDKDNFDFVIDGVPRGSTGKGFRAITHAAISCTLMKYTIENKLPHPKFLVLDSPLLAYYEPEGDDDSLVGTDLKEKFYEYLCSQFREEQVIVIENEPPLYELESMNTIHFTRNENKGRYGLFPI